MYYYSDDSNMWEAFNNEKDKISSVLKQYFQYASNNWNNFWKKVSEPASSLWKGLTGETSAEATKEANERNIENQNYWNEVAMEREDTAVQRRVADIQAAGLNPWLAISGNGAEATAMSTAEASPEDGSKILSATSAMALLAITRIVSKLIK